MTRRDGWPGWSSAWAVCRATTRTLGPELVPGGISLSIGRRVSVVVDVGLTQMFRAGILMGLVVVVHGGMIVLVVMGAHHVLPIRPVTLVMDDVSMLMSMDQGVVMVQCQRPRTSR